MASLVAENWVCINGDEDSNGVEANKFHTDFLMALLEEPQGDQEYSDEQLNIVIQSLRAEINEENLLEEDQDLAMKLPEFLASDKEGQHCLTSTDLGWANNMELYPSSPRDDMNWSLDPCEYESDGMVQFEYEGVCDYYPKYTVIPSESEEHGFRSFWHEIDNTVTYY